MRTVIFEDRDHASLLAHLDEGRENCEQILRLTQMNENRGWAGVASDKKRDALERLPSVRKRLADLVAWTDALKAANPSTDVQETIEASVPVEPTEADLARTRYAAMTDEEKIESNKARQDVSAALAKQVPYGRPGGWPCHPKARLPGGVRIAVIDAMAARMHEHENDAIGRFTIPEAGMTVGDCAQVIQAVQTMSSLENDHNGSSLMADRIKAAVYEAIAGYDVVLGVASISPQVRAIKPRCINAEAWGGTDTLLVQLVSDD